MKTIPRLDQGEDITDMSVMDEMPKGNEDAYPVAIHRDLFASVMDEMPKGNEDRVRARQCQARGPSP